MQQRTEEWHEQRKTYLTASRFGDVLAKLTTKRYQSYFNDILYNILGVPDFEDEKPWFKYGKHFEDEAIRMYEWQREVEIERTGLIIHPKYDFIGGSPDGLISNVGGIEVKCRSSIKSYMNSTSLDSNYKPQVQGYLWITKRDWFDFVNYYPSKKLMKVFRIEPDLKYHKKLEEACLDFWNKLKDIFKSWDYAEWEAKENAKMDKKISIL